MTIFSSKIEPLTSVGSVRVEPVQARSTRRVAALLDATAQVVHDMGYETLTTALVADRAGASIGTVYRYFPDRIAVLQALIGRNIHRAHQATVKALHSAQPTGIIDAMDVVFDTLVELFRSEPGYRSLRLGDVLDIRPVATARSGNQDFSHLLVEQFSDVLGLRLDSRARLAVETSVDVMDAMMGRAFHRVDRGDKPILDEARRVVHLILRDVL